MVVMVDTNVIIDFLTTREPFFEASSQIIERCANGEVGAKYIITRNTIDFSNSEVPAISPEDFMEIITR